MVITNTKVYSLKLLMVIKKQRFLIIIIERETCWALGTDYIIFGLLA
jgi:hypothetical protein